MSGPFPQYTRRLESELRRRFVLPGRLVAEIREHLEDARDEGLRGGLSVESAEREALARLGSPEALAASLAAGRYGVLDRMLVLCCAFTVAAVVYLTVGLLILHPPASNGRAWLPIATVLLAQSVATVLGVVGGPLGSWPRALAGVAGSAVVFMGGSCVYAALSGPHFEGYAIGLGSLVVLQGAMTVARMLRGRPRMRAAR
jgi:hypothetical protein